MQKFTKRDCFEQFLSVNFCIGKSSRELFAPRRLRWQRNEFKTK